MVQFSLRVLLVLLALCGLYFAAVRDADAISACMFLVFVVWLLLPLLLTFGTLYFRQQGWTLETWRRRNQARKQSPHHNSPRSPTTNPKS